MQDAAEGTLVEGWTWWPCLLVTYRSEMQINYCWSPHLPEVVRETGRAGEVREEQEKLPRQGWEGSGRGERREGQGQVFILPTASRNK